MIVFFAALPLGIFGKWGERQLKRLFLVYLWGMECGEIDALADEFAREVVKPMLYGEVVKRLEAHRERGDYCVMATASPSFYAGRIGDLLGFDLTLGTEVEYGGTVSFFPVLKPGNNKGVDKLNGLRRAGLVPASGCRPGSIAYSDSPADLPMLLAAEKRVLVNPSKKLVAEMNAEGNVEIIRPARLWKGLPGKIAFLIRIFFFF